MKKITLTFSEYLGVSFILSIFGILGKHVFDMNNLLTIFSYWAFRGFFIIFLVLAVRKWKEGWHLKDLGFRLYKGWRKSIWFGIIGFCLESLFRLPIDIANMPYQAVGLKEYLSQFSGMSLPMILIISSLFALFAGFITGAWHEEIWYRGYMQGLFSKKIAPAVGFFISAIPFGLSHHFSHPDYQWFAVIGVLIGGLFYCLVYYATGSIVVAMATHTLSNLIPVYAPLMYALGHETTAYIVLFGVALLMIILCFIGKKEVNVLLQKTKELFRQSGVKYSLIGIILGILILVIQWVQIQFSDIASMGIRIGAYLLLGTFLIWISSIREKEK